MNKKAIELSVNFFVVIILSIVMMSMGIMLIRNFFESAEEIKAEIDENTKAGIASLLSQGKMVAVFPAHGKIYGGQHGIVGLGILNVGNQADFTVSVEFNNAYNVTKGEIPENPPGVYDNWLFFDSGPYELIANEKVNVPIRIDILEGAESGTYIFNINVTKQGETYGGSIKKIFIDVP